jgi:hypothetical protein
VIYRRGRVRDAKELGKTTRNWFQAFAFKFNLFRYTLDIRRKTLDIVLDLITMRNIDEVGLLSTRCLHGVYTMSTRCLTVSARCLHVVYTLNPVDP